MLTQRDQLSNPLRHEIEVCISLQVQNEKTIQINTEKRRAWHLTNENKSQTIKCNEDDSVLARNTSANHYKGNCF